MRTLYRLKLIWPQKLCSHTSFGLFEALWIWTQNPETSGLEQQHSTKINFDYFLFYRVFRSLPVYSQHLLVLLIGTFRVIHANSERAKTGMTAEALGVSVAPSFFHTCCLEGKIAKPEEVQKFKVNLITFVYLVFTLFLGGIIHIYSSTF